MSEDWWQLRKEELLRLAGDGTPLYVYNEEVLNETFFDLLWVDGLDRIVYPVRANPHPEVLRKAFEMDLDFGCVSSHEITSLLKTIESGVALAGARVRGLETGHGVFQAREIALPGTVPRVSILILAWTGETGPGHKPGPLDMPDLEYRLQTLKASFPRHRLWLEVPGSMIARAGVLLTRVTHTGSDGELLSIRINTGLEGLFPDKTDHLPHGVINLSGRWREGPGVPIRIIGKDGKGVGQWRLVEGSVLPEKGHILLFSNMGVYEPGRGFDPEGRGPVPEHYMRARSMCQVKI